MLPVSADSPNSDSLQPYGQPEHQFPDALEAGPEFDAHCPVRFRSIKFRCHVNRVSGAAIVATCPNVLRPSFFALTASRRRWSSLNFSHGFPICSRRTCAWRIPIYPNLQLFLGC